MGLFYIDENLDVWISGRNENGQLGLGDCRDRIEYTKIPGIDQITQISNSEKITALLDITGSVWVCGKFWYNYYTKIVDTPEIIQVACADNFILLLDINNCVWMYDRTGNLSKIQNIPPIQQMGCNDLKKILLLDVDGNLWSCKSFQNESIFEKLENLPHIETISVGALYDMSLDTEGNIWWFKDRSNINIPIKIENLPKIKQIASNCYCWCALDAEGDLWSLDLYGDHAIVQNIPKIQQIYQYLLLDINGNVWESNNIFGHSYTKMNANNSKCIIGINCPIKKPNKTKSSRY